MTKRTAAALLALAIGALACAAPQSSPSRPPQPVAPLLRIGMTADSPPFAFRQGDRMAGIEVDFAKQLAAALGRPVRLTEMSWESLIPALLNGDIDIIMSGMTITRLRQLRVAFADPYLESGLAVLVRRSDAEQYPTPASVLKGSLQIGVVRDTTGEKYVKENEPGTGQVLTYSSNAVAVIELQQRRLDAFVTDLPIVAYYASANEGSLTPLYKPLLTREEIAWGFRPGDEELRASANAALARWKGDGTLAAIVGRWLPRWSEVTAR